VRIIQRSLLSGSRDGKADVERGGAAAVAFVAWGRALELPCRERALSRFEVPPSFPLCLAMAWPELLAPPVPHLFIAALTVSVQLLGTHVQVPDEFCLKT